MDIEFTKRKITLLEAKLMVEHVKLTPNIVGYTAQEWMDSEHTVVAQTGSTLIGACLSYNFHQKWRKVAALIINKEFRNHGAGKALFYKACDDAAAAGKSVYTVSANPIVIKMMSDLGFEKFSSLGSLTRKYPYCGLSICLHSLLWLMHWYRLKETIRKTLQYSRESSFVFGIKLAKTTTQL